MNNWYIWYNPDKLRFATMKIIGKLQKEAFAFPAMGIINFSGNEASFKKYDSPQEIPLHFKKEVFNSNKFKNRELQYFVMAIFVGKVLEASLSED
jgi:hypothetical protein